MGMQSVSNPSLIRLYLETDKCPSLMSVSNFYFSCSATINNDHTRSTCEQNNGHLGPCINTHKIHQLYTIVQELINYSLPNVYQNLEF